MKRTILFALLLSLQANAQRDTIYENGYGVSLYAWINRYASLGIREYHDMLRKPETLPFPDNLDQHHPYHYVSYAFQTVISAQYTKLAAYKAGKSIRYHNFMLGYLILSDRTQIHTFWDDDDPNSYSMYNGELFLERPEILMGYGQELHSDRKERNIYGGLSVVLSNTVQPKSTAEIDDYGYNGKMTIYRNLEMKNSSTVWLQATFGVEYILEKNFRLRIEGRPGYACEIVHDGPVLWKYHLPLAVGLRYMTGVK